MFDKQEMIDALQEFAEIYKNRPIKDNAGGMKSPHMFPTWFVAKKLKPKYIIESGVFKGQGTWLFEQASPNSKLICIEPNLSGIIYKNKDAQYLDKDMKTYNWDWIDKDNTLVFLDDHQNAFERIKFLHQNGFKYAMFEDNYPLNQGDCYSLKKAFYNEKDKAEINDLLDIYYEFPPVCKLEKTRWKDDWDEENYPTPQPLLETVIHDYQSIYLEEASDYTWICYVEIKNDRQ